MVKRGQRWRTATWLAAALLAATAASATSAATVAYFVWTPGLDGVANSALELMNPETGETRVIAEFERAAGLDASADGRRLVCRTGTWYGSRLTLIDARTGVAEHLPREHELGVYRGPKFSPDGHQVLYNYAQPAGAPFAVKVMDLGARSSTWLTPRGYRAWDPDWAPDGSQIVLVQKDPRKLYHDLHVMPAEGGDALNLTFWLEHDDEPAWSPDGKEIAFIRAHEDKGARRLRYGVWGCAGVDRPCLRGVPALLVTRRATYRLLRRGCGRRGSRSRFLERVRDSAGWNRHA